MQLDQGSVPVTSAVSTADAEFPTLQFAESVKGFVSKCQALSISSEEYHLMKLIALFQSAGQLSFFSYLFFCCERCQDDYKSLMLVERSPRLQTGNIRVRRVCYY